MEYLCDYDDSSDEDEGGSCPFELNELVDDEIFGRANVIKLYCTDHPGQVLIECDAPCADGTMGSETRWRTWGHLTKASAPSPAAPSAAMEARGRRAPQSRTDEPPQQRGFATGEQPSARPRGQSQQLSRPPRALEDAEGQGPPKKQATLTTFGLIRVPNSQPASTCTAAGASSSAAAGSAAAAGVPRPAAIERERSLKTKQPSSGKRAARGPADEGPQHPQAKLALRLKEFPDDTFYVCEGRLRCSSCKCVVACDKKSQTAQHTHTAKHKAALEKTKRRAASDESVIDDIGIFFKEHPEVVGTTVTREEQAFRYRVTETLLCGGIPILKADVMRNLLQRSGHASTHSSHLRGLIPLVEKREIAKTRSEIAGEHLCVAFDGTRRAGEAVNMTGRFCSKDFRIVMRLLAFITVFKSFDAAELVRLIAPILLQHLGIDPSMIICFARDAVACNGLAMATLSTLFGTSEDLPCVCHTLSHMGEHFDFPLLDSFMTPWYTLVCNNPAAKLLWKETICEAVKGYSNVRW